MNDPPPDWKPGKPFVSDLLGPALEVPALEVEEERVPSPERQAREGRFRTLASAKPTAKKRSKTYVPDECTQYRFAYEIMARERWGCDMATSFRVVQRLAPEN